MSMSARQNARRWNSTLAALLLACLALAACTPVHAPLGSEQPTQVASAAGSPGLQSSGVVLKDGKELPNLAVVKQRIVQYNESGLWKKQLDQVSKRAQKALDTAVPEPISPTKGGPALVLDIDDTALSTFAIQLQQEFGFVPEYWDQWVREAIAPPNVGVLALYRHAVERGVAVFFVTGRRERLRDATERQLRSAGYDQWRGLVLKPNGYAKPSVVPYKSAARREIEKRGYRIVVNVGDQWSDLEGGLSEATFKLPNPMYYIP
ncbi:MAG: acid phosphatase [Deltaproteobacteria bacterium]|nr:acid phosphatase [Deltaproteobacteria bacterium]